MMSFLVWAVLAGAAILEVAGDAVVRKGLRGASLIGVCAGCVTLAAYGVVVNVIKWDFSKLLGVYVAVFAVVAVLFGRVVFREDVPTTTWLGLGVIIFGGLIIQFGSR